jgi:hypothetical protein
MPVSVLALVGAAVAWGAMLLVLAAVLPVVTRQQPSVLAPPPGQTSTTVSTATHVTLVSNDGYGVLALIALPVLASVLVGMLLRINGSTGGPAGVAALVVAVLVLVAGVVGFLTYLIGGAVIPVGVLLIVACLRGAPAPKGNPVARHPRQHGERA